MNLGYACINTGLSANKVMTNRTMRRKTFDAQGIDYVSDLALANVKDLKTIVQWNNEMGIKLFRLSSQIFPWSDEYDITHLKDIVEINELMLEIGQIATDTGQRLTMHPGPYNCLASPTQKVVDKTIRELNFHSEQFNMMGYTPSNYNKINIHVGGAYGDKKATLKRWIDNYYKLNHNTQARLTVENDDKANMYSVKELYKGISEECGVPIVFDYYHHKFCTGGLTEQQALELAAKTWPKDIVPCTHYSESRRKEHLDESIRAQAHSDRIVDTIKSYGLDIDVVVEAKHKELAVLNYKH